MVKNNSHNANYRNEGLSAFLFYCDEKRKADRKEKHAIHNNAFGIVTPSDISIERLNVFVLADKNQSGA